MSGERDHQETEMAYLCPRCGREGIVSGKFARHIEDHGHCPVFNWVARPVPVDQLKRVSQEIGRPLVRRQLEVGGFEIFEGRKVVVKVLSGIRGVGNVTVVLEAKGSHVFTPADLIGQILSVTLEQPQAPSKS